MASVLATFHLQLTGFGPASCLVKVTMPVVFFLSVKCPRHQASWACSVLGVQEQMVPMFVKKFCDPEILLLKDSAIELV